MGGLRLFSFGDYMPWMDNELNKIIKDAEKRKLKLKVITKQLDFVIKYRGVMTINYSIDLVDAIDDPVSLEPYLTYMRYVVGTDTKLRCLVRNKKEAELIYEYVDILTPYHGPKIDNNYRPKESKEACIALAPEKTCCITGKCETCLVRCGYEEN
jgi:hypothetical protein